MRRLIFALFVLVLIIWPARNSNGQGPNVSEVKQAKPPAGVSFRRVVTGKNAEGKSTVISDGPTPWLPDSGDRFGVWITHSSPADNSGNRDALEGLTARPRDITNTFFEVAEFPPGRGLDASGRPSSHDAITPTVDYAIVLRGEVDMRFEDKSEVHLKQGDIVVVGGVGHNWINRGKQPAWVAIILIAAKPLQP